ncbi:MAG TPA: 3-carboxy-cis,cis-muconate cycloisomerase [Candidatus Angelobacter sp.]|nr:3-carboxy-cis,cis-muconate cycloisomerase [Candidatus Angelobacter sp.]
MSVRFMESLATTAPLSLLFSDELVFQAMLDFEAALARVQARLELIPQSAAVIISKVAHTSEFAPESISAIAGAALRAGTPAIPVVKALTERVRSLDPVAAGFVHWGATSQDVADTALVLLLKRALAVVGADLSRLEQALQKLSEQHASSVMLGRTLLQAAPPVTFGLKAAGWLAALRRTQSRLNTALAEALVVQFGGASGTTASLGSDGLAVGKALAAELLLGFPDAPWHTHRDRLAFLMSACGVLAGVLGKMARDVSLLAQSEVAEAAEPFAGNRGGSSTMPNKRNPVGCAVALAASFRVPALVSSFLSAMVQEHERGLGGWQAEWPIVSSLVQACGVAALSMAEVMEGIAVDKERMRTNIEATHGMIFAERAMMLLGPSLGRDAAHKIIEKALQNRQPNESLIEILERTPQAAKLLDRAMLQELTDPERYLGIADELRKRQLVQEARAENKEDRAENKKE